MRITLVIAVLGFFMSCGSTETLVVSNIRLMNEAIYLCLEHARDNGVEDTLQNSDRVYVSEFGNDLSVLFTKGSVGTFKERDDDYRAILSCGIDLRSSGLSLNYLSKPIEEPIIGSVDHVDIPGSDVRVELDSLFYIIDGGFSYCCSKEY